MDRLPPGQYFTERYPVLHVGDVPTVDPSTWTLRLFGLVRAERTLTWADLHALPEVEVVTDIHCVTKWSKFDMRWRGVRVRDVLALVEIEPSVTHVLQHAEYGYTTNTPIADLYADDVLLGWALDGEPARGRARRSGADGAAGSVLLEEREVAERGLEFLDHDQHGFWEQNGYHNDGDPWREQRYWGD